MDLNIDAHHLSQTAAMAWSWALLFLPRLAGAVAILAVGAVAVGWLGRVVARVLAHVPISTAR